MISKLLTKLKVSFKENWQIKLISFVITLILLYIANQ